MPGSNNGTGYPLALRCYWCRRSTLLRFASERTHLGRRLIATGETRPLGRRHHIGYRQTNRLIQYQCLDCYRKGWSQHSDGERLPRNRSDLGESHAR